MTIFSRVRIILAATLVLLAWSASLASAQPGCSARHNTLESQPLFRGTFTNFSVANREGYLVEPFRPRLPGSPWIWIMGYSPADDAGDNLANRYANALLDAGYVIGFYTIGATHGSPGGVRLMEDFYACVTADFSVSPKAYILAQSNGGLQAYAYAATYPAHVDRIGAIYPAVDWRSWPGLANLVAAPADVAFTAAERANEDTFNPINNLAPLAAAGIKLFHLHGDHDLEVPMGPNTLETVTRYRALGGEIDYEVIWGLGHGQKPEFYRPPMIRFLMGLTPTPTPREPGVMIFARPGGGD